MDSRHDKRYYRNGEDLRFRITSSAEERELFSKARQGCEKSREFLIRNHLLYAAMLARRIAKSALDDDELVSAANNAVMGTIDRFDFSRGNRYSTYLKHFVRGEVLELLQEKRKTPISGVDDEILLANLCDGFIEHAAEQLDFDSFRRNQLKKVFAQLNPRDRKLLSEIYLLEKSFAQVARERKVTRQAICNSHAKILKKLRAMMDKECKK